MVSPQVGVTHARIMGARWVFSRDNSGQMQSLVDPQKYPWLLVNRALDPVTKHGRQHNSKVVMKVLRYYSEAVHVKGDPDASHFDRGFSMAGIHRRTPARTGVRSHAHLTEEAQ